MLSFRSAEESASRGGKNAVIFRCYNFVGDRASAIPLREQCSLLRSVQACRGVAQPGRAPGSGPGGRRFKSSRPDQFCLNHLKKIAEIPRQVSLHPHFHCAQNCAHSADPRQRELHLRSGERTGQTSQRNYGPRFAPESKHRNPTPRVLLRTCDASCTERKGERG